MAGKVVGTGAKAAAPTVGVIGGGQLARMMQEAAVPLGIELRALVEAADGSAGQAIPESRIGDADDAAAVLELASRVDVLTVEHEHVPDSLLAKAGELVPVRPGSSALAFAQDKLHMREKMDEIGVACPRWARVETYAEAAAAVESFGGEAVLKTPRDGYDGKGVAVIRLVDGAVEPRSLVDSWLASGPMLVEEKVPFTRELAQLVARSPRGEIRSWCVVETIQDHGVCFETIAPARVSESVASAARQMGERIAEELGIVGILAVEMFLVDGEADAGLEATGGSGVGTRVLVNELAMRPHNSGHWTIDGAITSQFEQHLRAVLNLPLGATDIRAPWTVMINVLGSELTDPREAYPRVMSEYPNVKIHMYGKEVKPRRKIGHVTAYGVDLETTREQAHAAAAILRGE